jgi:predicted transcriptional regulator
MDWKSLIADLAKSGLTQKDIGDAVGLSQPAVSDLARGRTASPVWEIGEALRRLHVERLPVVSAK